jgi:hypothetical protein
MVALTPGPERPFAHQSTGSLLKGVAENVRELVGQEIDQLKAEVREQLVEARRAVAIGAIGGGLLAIGGIVLAIAAGELLALALPRWGAYAVIGGAMALIGIVALAVGRKKVAEVSVIPRQAIRSAVRDARWTKNETISAVKSTRHATN